MTQLAIALGEVERFFGSGWFWSPGRWRTSDGAVPWPEFVVGLQVMRVVQARERLGAVRVQVTGRAAVAGKDQLYRDERHEARLED